MIEIVLSKEGSFAIRADRMEKNDPRLDGGRNLILYPLGSISYEAGTVSGPLDSMIKQARQQAHQENIPLTIIDPGAGQRALHELHSRRTNLLRPSH